MLRVCSFLGLLTLVGVVSGQEKTLPIGSGDLQHLSALADKVTQRGAGQVQQLVITGHYANGGVRDLTRHVKYRATNAGIARVDANGLVTTVANGSTDVIA